MSQANLEPVTIPQLKSLKAEGRKLTMLTSFHASSAQAIAEGEIDLILVGDSLGFTAQGQNSTAGVSMDDMVYHSRCVRQGIRHAGKEVLMVTDLPFQSYADPISAHEHAARLMAEGGADMVKLEGAGYTLDVIRYLTERQIPVCAHLGLTPQSAAMLGGYKVQGQGEEAAQKLMKQADAVTEAGAVMLVLECIPTALAQAITQTITTPTIGIGAGPYCDGQVLVFEDMIGMTSGRKPKFVKNFLAGEGAIHRAIAAFGKTVRDGSYPGKAHSYGWDEAHA